MPCWDKPCSKTNLWEYAYISTKNWLPFCWYMTNVHLFEKDRHFLRFFWFRDNDPSKDIAENQHMLVHIYGNSPSSAVAIYGPRQSVQEWEVEYGPGVRQLVERDFFVGNCLKSLPSSGAAISLLKRGSGSTHLLKPQAPQNSFQQQRSVGSPLSPRSNDLRDCDLEADSLPVKCSIGLLWDLKSNSFALQVNRKEKPFCPL